MDEITGIHQAVAKMAFGEAEARARTALARNPNSAQIQLLLAQALEAQHKSAEVEAVLSQAVVTHAGLAETNLIYGLWLQGRGRFDEARTFLVRSLEIEPRQGMAHRALTKCGRVEDRKLVTEMEEVAGKMDTQQRGYLYYALGKAREDLGEYEASLKAFDEANRICWTLRPDVQRFDPEKHALPRQRLRSYFNQARMRRQPGLGFETELPIFIVGMPRSGTTLLEQMLSSHSEVGAAGELPFWMMRAGSAIDKRSGELDPLLSRKLAEEYQATLESAAPGAKRVTDKMPLNYLNLGYIQLALPKAKAIHVRRSPIDNCLSLYTTDYRVPPEFAHNRANIVIAYRQYEEMMQHWRRVLPEDWMLEVDYETLVKEPEREIRRLLEFCGLSFMEACLHPERNERPIRTPSLWQARQPIYQSSLERWRRFEPWLGEFRALLPTS